MYVMPDRRRGVDNSITVRYVRSTSPPSTPAAAGAPITRTPPPTDTPRPPPTGLGSPSAPIDGGKLGLLPKRPISLLRSQSPPAGLHAPGLETQYSQQSQDDSDGLEYAENPFDEPKARK
ncbi:hypothetical protein D9615_002640 [Tricholomella constricta]|uniref:Uncharacterized protein n=1 Tax=Tricholomella constricta TaxID=117010 RepID=A0A8H5HMS5_9AGAR|nr:hypothetical protein D9615_002640 [Tricholomella constricta]